MSVDGNTQIGVNSTATSGVDMASELGFSPETLHPLLQGARARGFADAFEMLGQAVALVGPTGEILHMTSAARRMLGAGVAIAENHLVTTTSTGNRRLSAILSEALDDMPGSGGEAEIADGLRARAVGLGAGFGGPYQLLRAAVFLEAAA
jgi:hypothetical protein